MGIFSSPRFPVIRHFHVSSCPIGINPAVTRSLTGHDGKPSITDNEGAPNYIGLCRIVLFSYDQASWQRRMPKNESGRNFKVTWDFLLLEPSTVFAFLCVFHKVVMSSLPPLPKVCLSPQTPIRLPYLFISVFFYMWLLCLRPRQHF